MENKDLGNNAMKAIRAKCVDCSGGNTAEVRKCEVYDCPLWTFRMGVRPSTLKSREPELLDRNQCKQ